LRAIPTRLAIAATAAALVLGAVGCSSSDDDSTAAAGTGGSPDTNEAADNDEAANNDEVGDGNGGSDAGSSGGSATITIGPQTWTFDQVRCGFGEDEIGSPGAELVVAASRGPISLYASVEADFSYIELADLETDGEGVTWTTQGVDAADPVISESGGSVSSEAMFMSYGADGAGDPETAEGTLEATCP
jgi:hypothetical protein